MSRCRTLPSHPPGVESVLNMCTLEFADAKRGIKLQFYKTGRETRMHKYNTLIFLGIIASHDLIKTHS